MPGRVEMARRARESIAGVDREWNHREDSVSTQRKEDAVAYLKEVLRNASHDMPREIQIILGEMILHAYLRGREDEARLHKSSN